MQQIIIVHKLNNDQKGKAIKGVIYGKNKKINDGK